MLYRSQSVSQVPPYLFAELNKKKEALIRSGVDVIDLGIGDPDLPTPEPIVDQLTAEMRNPANFKYPSYVGCQPFREAVAGFYKRQFHVELDPNREVLALIGSKEGIAHFVPSIIDPGDLVLIPDPGYPVYRTATTLANGQYHLMPLSNANHFEPDFQAIPEEIARQAKLMFLNYPGNPTAATVDLAFFQRAVDYARHYQIAIAHDSAYNMVTFDGYEAPSILQVDGAKEYAVEFGSLSKTYNMTGWRIGYAVGNAAMIQSLAILKNNTDTGQFTPIQKAAAFALNSDSRFISERNQIYRERMNAVLGGLAAIGIRMDPPRGSFFIWAPVPVGYSSADFATELLEQTGVIVAPGNAFGPSGEGYFRISVSVPTSRLQEAMERIASRASQIIR